MMMRQRWCKRFWVRSHILDRLLVSSCRASILTVFTFSEGNALTHSCTPNKHSCIYPRQDNTHLIWTCNSFPCCLTSQSSWFTSGRQRLCNTGNICARLAGNVRALNPNTLPYYTPTLWWLHFLCHDITVWIHSLQMWEPTLLNVWEAINTNALGAWQTEVTSHIKTQLPQQ